MRAMVLAAGVGSRLDPLTTQLPKPLVPIANVPVMEHIINLLSAHDFKEICANLHYMPDQLVEYFGDGSSQGVSLTFHHEAKLTGDAGGVRSCQKFLSQGTFIVLMGDLVTDADLSAIVARHKAKGALASIAIMPVEDVSRFGVAVTNKEGLITGFQEKPKKEEALSNLISTGIYVLEPEVFQYIPAQGEYGFGRQLFPSLVARGFPVLGVEIDGYWSDVGTIDQYRLSNFDALKGAVKVRLPYSQPLLKSHPNLQSMQGIESNMFWIDASARIDSGARIEGLVMIGKNSQIEKGVELKGTVVIGDDVLVRSDAYIENSVVWNGSVIGDGAQVSDCVIGLNCHIAPRSKQSAVAKVESAPPAVGCS